MTDLEKRLKLAEEAKNLIIEYRKEIDFVFEEYTLEEISINEDGSVIHTVDTYDGEEDHELICISQIFTGEMRGWGPCPARLKESISLAQGLVDGEYRNMDRERYINYVGGLYYLDHRTEEIYQRLLAIEKEAEELLED